MIGLYIHVPYCSVRCSYCDFYLVSSGRRDLESFRRALCGEIGSVGNPIRGRRADSVHFGGGTPSLLTAAALGTVLKQIAARFDLTADSEIALEANPEDLGVAALRELRAIGFNRICIGVQTLDDAVLRTLRRSHRADECLDAIERARRSGIRSVGVDLILGLPGADPSRILADIDRLVGLGVDHVSLYLLEVHDRTRLGRQVALGRLSLITDDTAAALFEEAADRLGRHGFEHYEISNFARAGHRSRHNLKYWTDQDYLGFGPSASSYVDGRRWSNPADLAAYLTQGGVGLARLEDPQPPAGRGAEALFAGLRISEGVDLAALRGRYGAALPSPSDPAILELRAAGFLDLSGDRLRLTSRGRLVSNEIFERLMPDAEHSIDIAE